MTVCYGWKVTRQQGEKMRSSRDFVLGLVATELPQLRECVFTCVCVVFDHLIITLLFFLLSSELCKQDREVDTHPLCLGKSHKHHLFL